MTFQEAKKIMEQQLVCANCKDAGLLCGVCENGRTSNKEWIEALQMAVVALKRVIP
jgi:hypothetical protein